MKTPFIFITYIVAIALANLSAATFGPGITILNAFILIAFDLTIRDLAHEQWTENHLWPRMLILIASGGAVSYLLNAQAGSIAIASLVAFSASSIVDTFVYQALRTESRLLKMNTSNTVSSLVDSTVFPTVAFGSFLPEIVLGQWAAKIAGGFLWSLVLNRVISRNSV